MLSNKNKKPKIKLHPRNRNRERYDLKALCISNPELKNYIIPNKFGEESIDFSAPQAVKLLNKAILNHYYGIKYWAFPDENLCPPIPGRAEYIHKIADLMVESNLEPIKSGAKVTCLDIGVGASCIYPIIGVSDYEWNFIATDIDPKSIATAQNIIEKNSSLKNKIECRVQENVKNIFIGVIGDKEKIEISICNPPFHTSIEEAQQGSRRKIENLNGESSENILLNFSGNNKELVCDGGEYGFIRTMIRESEVFSKNCFWFTTLVSKQSNLDALKKFLRKTKATKIKTIKMGTGNKASRILAWTFLTDQEQQIWKITG